MSDANQAQFQKMEHTLEKRRSAGLYRRFVAINGATDFCSNDYLGFARLQLQPTQFYNVPAGSTGSRLLSGNSLLAEETEHLIAFYHQADAALIFNSGYNANLGLFSSIAARGDTIITDELIHASIIDGARLSHASRFKFRHNDLSDLEKKMQNSTGQIFVAVESIYSMDGDEAPLVEVAGLCKKYHALLIVDEAHATGIFGGKGEGLVCKYGLQDDVFACIYTFGKALGLHGAAVTGSNSLRNYLVNFARSFIYTTALPPQTYFQLQETYRLLPSADRTSLFHLITYFRAKVAGISQLAFINSHSPIQGILIKDNWKSKDVETKLFEKGFFTKAIVSPTVKVGEERLRICLHSFNTTTEIDGLLNELLNILHECNNCGHPYRNW